MIRLLLIAVLLPFAAEAQVSEEATVSPRGAFKIVQHYDGNWTQVLSFVHSPMRTVTLEEGISWPGLYYVSPDERWVLRIQKSGSGDNLAWLYHLDTRHHVHRMEGELGALAFGCLAPGTKLPGDPYHTGVDFESWDTKAGLLHLTIHSSGTGLNGHRFERPISYHLGSRVMTSP